MASTCQLPNSTPPAKELKYLLWSNFALSQQAAKGAVTQKILILTHLQTKPMKKV